MRFVALPLASHCVYIPSQNVRSIVKKSVGNTACFIPACARAKTALCAAAVSKSDNGVRGTWRAIGMSSNRNRDLNGVQHARDSSWYRAFGERGGWFAPLKGLTMIISGLSRGGIARTQRYSQDVIPNRCVRAQSMRRVRRFASAAVARLSRYTHRRWSFNVAGQSPDYNER